MDRPHAATADGTRSVPATLQQLRDRFAVRQDGEGAAAAVAAGGCGSSSNGDGDGGGDAGGDGGQTIDAMNDTPIEIPQKLSALGLFIVGPDGPGHAADGGPLPAAGGLRYRLSTPLFSDYALKWRSVHIPNGRSGARGSRPGRCCAKRRGR